MDRSLVEGAKEFARTLEALLKVSKSMQHFIDDPQTPSKDILYHCILLGAVKDDFKTIGFLRLQSVKKYFTILFL